MKSQFSALLRYRTKIEAREAAGLASLPECGQTIVRLPVAGTGLSAGALALEMDAARVARAKRARAEAGLREARRARAQVEYLERRFFAEAERRRERGEARELDERNRMRGTRP